MNNIPSKSLARIAKAWKESSHTLLSVPDMIKFLGYEFIRLYSELEYQGYTARDVIKMHGPQSFPTPELRDELTKLVDDLWWHCNRLLLGKGKTSLSHFKRMLLQPPDQFPFQIILNEVNHVWTSINDELRDRTFTFIHPNDVRFFEQTALFGKVVNRAASRQIKAEIRTAGNCLASGLDTAAVFHLMCIVEHGLRALARRLKVKTVKKSRPIEFGTWEEIIKALEKRIDTLRAATLTAKRQKDLDFYNELLSEYRGFKDLWRNKVAHARVSYDHNRALSAFTHVCAFTRRLAQRVPLK